MRRDTFIKAAQREASLAIAAAIKAHAGYLTASSPLGFYEWLLAASSSGVVRSTTPRVAWVAWRERVSGPALARRFASFGLQPPVTYIDAVRAAHVGYLLANGITVREVAEAAACEPKYIYGLLNRVLPDHTVPAPERVRAHDPLWVARILVHRLLRIPAFAWTVPRLVRMRWPARRAS